MFTNKKLALLLVAFLCLTAVARPYRRRYKYYLDVSRAEEVLAGIPLKPRLGNEDWLKLVGDRQLSSITIQPGDNLWRLSGRAFRDPFLWRKLWEQNPFLTNPHELEPGQVLQYYREGQAEESNVIRIPLVKLLPDLVGQAADLDNDSLINLDIKSRFRPVLLVITEDQFLGEISGSYSEHDALGRLDKVYVRLKSMQGVSENDRFAVVREERKLPSKSIGGNRIEGLLMRLVAEAKVVQVGEKYVQVELVSHFGIVRRGDKLISAVKPVQWNALYNPPEGLTTRILSGEEEEYEHFGQGQLVLLDKGAQEGMKEGLLFRVYRDTDPVTEERAGVPADFKAEIQVVYSGKLSSVGYILRNSVPITAGDICVASQIFPSAPPPVVKAHETTEIP